MFGLNLPILEEKMKEAKTILSTDYRTFEELITNNKIKYGSPFWDIACFLTLNEIENEKREEQWIKFWEENTTKQRYRNHYYNAPESFRKLPADEEIKKIFRKMLEEKEKEEIITEWDSFLEFFYRLRERTRPILTKQEYHMLQEIVKNQTLSNIILKENTGIDLSNISKYKKKLIEKGVIFPGITFNPITLRLKIYLVELIFPANHKVEVKKVLGNTSFSRRIFENVDNLKTYVMAYLAPDEERTEKYLEKMCKKIEEKYPLKSYKIYKIIREKRKITLNYENYNPKTRNWAIEEKILELIMKNYLNSKKEKVTFETKEFTEEKKKDIVLTKGILNMFSNLMINFHASTKQRAEELGIKETEVKKHLNYLYDNEIIKERIHCIDIFGQSTISLYIQETSERQEELHNFFSIYPEVFTEPYETKESKGISILIRCPHENIRATQDMINHKFSDKIEQVSLLNQIDANGVIIPIEKYNTEQQKWEFTEEDIMG